MEVRNDEMERWLPVVGWEDLYLVSSHGRVRSLHKRSRAKEQGRILKQSPGAHRQYPIVILSRSPIRKTAPVHHLVAEAFIGPRPEGMEICHGDGNPQNNRASNLRYGTKSENTQDEINHGTHYYASRTHCNRGHALVESNIYRSKGNPKARQCRACRADRRDWPPADFSQADGMIDTRAAGDLLGIAWKSVYVFSKRYADFPQPKRIRNRLFWDRDALLAWRTRHPAAA